MACVVCGGGMNGGSEIAVMGAGGYTRTEPVCAECTADLGIVVSVSGDAVSRSAHAIIRWSGELARNVDNYAGAAWYRVQCYMAGQILGRHPGENAAALFERRGLTEFAAWYDKQLAKRNA